MEHQSFKASAILLKQQPYREADRILTWYTKDTGKCVSLARSSKYMLAHLICVDVLTLAEIQLHFSYTKNWYIITGIKIIDSFNGIRGDFLKTLLALKCVDITNSLTPHGESSTALFNLLSDTLIKINTATDNYLSYSIFSSYLTRAFEYLGYKLKLGGCIFCDRETSKLENEDVYFIAEEGGIICGKCLTYRNYYSQQPLTPGLISRLSEFMESDVPKITSPDIMFDIEYTAIYEAYAAQLLHYTLKTSRFNHLLTGLCKK
ncbi:MAG: DNA repair protein RecO [Elusimicrobiota bacterium]